MMDSGRLIFDSTSSSSNPGCTLFFQGERSLFGMEQRTNKRLPFFTSSEELEEEYYDDQLPEKKRRLTAEQVHMLEKSFESENKLEPERKGELAKKLGLQPRQVAVWFQNRRARWKTKQLEHDYDRLKAAYDALLADHDSLLKDNNCLRSQTQEKKPRKSILRTELANAIDIINKDLLEKNRLKFLHWDLNKHARREIRRIIHGFASY